MDKTPTTHEEYLARTHANTKITGYGMEVRSHYPCPFCAAPNWAEHLLMEMKEVMSKPHICSECGRSAKLIFTEAPGSTSFEMVQTGGPPPPAYFTHNMRRVEDGE